MRKPTLVPTLAGLLFALLLTASTSVYGIDRVMNIGFFTNQVGGSIDFNAPQSLLVRPGQYRQFDFLVSVGSIASFDFTYTSESEITPTGFILEGVKTDGTPTGHYYDDLVVALPGIPTTYEITPAIINFLFNGSSGSSHVMVYPERIRVIENFDVKKCSPPDNDETYFSLKWDCDSLDSNPLCINQLCCENLPCSDCTSRSILVQTSTRGLVPVIDIQKNPLDICAAYNGGLTLSDIVVGFRNQFPAHDVGKIVGSAMKSLQTVEFSMKQDVFVNGGGTFLRSSIRVEDETGNISEPLDSFPTAFYTYTGTGANPYRVILDFTTLTSLPGGFTDPISSPLVNGFLQDDGAFNELKENRGIRLRFIDAKFDGKNAKFYNGFGFVDCQKPDQNFMFFGPGNRIFNFNYLDMCGNPPTPENDDYDYGNYFNNFPVTPIGTAQLSPGGGSDMEKDEIAELDFSYASTGFDSPFTFLGPLSPTLYFFHKPLGVDTYQVVLAIPTDYALDLNTVKYNPDPNGTSGIGTPVLLDQFSGPLLEGNNYVYTFTDPTSTALIKIGSRGRITAMVQLTNCPENNGILYTFTTKIQAIHDGCSACAYTITCLSAQMFAHCKGTCGGGPPQQTEKFTLRRKSFGTDPSTGTGIDPSTGIAPDPATSGDRGNAGRQVGAGLWG